MYWYLKNPTEILLHNTKPDTQGRCKTARDCSYILRVRVRHRESIHKPPDLENVSSKRIKQKNLYAMHDSFFFFLT